MMKIKTTNKKVPQTHVEIRFVEKGVNKVVREGKMEAIEIVSGKLSRITPRKLQTIIRDIVRTAKAHKISKLSVSLDYSEFKGCKTYGEEWFWSTVAENLHLANYEFDVYKTKKQPLVSEVCLTGRSSKTQKNGVARGIKVADGTNIARELSNTPGGDMTPEKLASQVKKVFRGTKVKVKILNYAEIKKLKMGGVLGVGKGAKSKPRFIILEYNGGAKKDKPLLLVGKGVTFDTGGLQIKPGLSMYEMHMDMSGGAAAIGAMKGINDLKLKKNVVALIPAVENAVGESAIRPGDIITMMSGTTVDVLHTDAEGRLILADALHYAHRYDPKLVVDIATLTGAATVAVGSHASAIMTKDRKLEDKLRDFGEESGDYVAPLPLWEEYKQHIKGIQGDISNISSNGKQLGGGAITGGIFLSYFTKKLKWVHIDMAPRMTTVESDKLAKGSSGEPTRLLIKIIEKS
jgi:leucyl aminopeptidase